MEQRRAVCVQCRVRPVDPACRPFCSERCRLLDLRNWMDGRYRIPGRAGSSLPQGEEAADEKP